MGHCWAREVRGVGHLCEYASQCDVLAQSVETALSLTIPSLCLGFAVCRYRSLAPMYYRGAQAAIVVYDVTSQDSFDAAKAWIKELKKKMEPGVVLALVANKVDLGPGMRRIEADEGRLLATDNGLLYAETSAKTALNVHELFLEIARRVPLVPSAGPPGSGGAGRRSGVNLAAPAGGGAAAGGAGSGGSGGGCCGS